MSEDSQTPADESQSPPDAQSNVVGPPENVLPPRPRIELGPPVFGKFAVWIVVVPFIVYLCGMMLGGYTEQLRKYAIEGILHHHDEGENRIEIDRSEAYENIDPNQSFLGVFKLAENTYPQAYSFVIILTTILIIAFGWGYFKAPFRISVWSIVAGLVGIVVWIGLTELDRQTLDLGRFSEREAFNPFEELKDKGTWLWTFLGIRFFGLVIVVPLVEEFFVRGFLMRYVDDPDWDQVPLGVARLGGWISPTIYGVVAHMTEPVAALVWFSMVTLLYKKTGSIWDCVVAHSITNVLLGIYVVQRGAWYLW